MRARRFCILVFLIHLALLTPQLYSQGLLEKLEKSLGRGSVPDDVAPEEAIAGYLGLSADQLQPGFIGVVKVEDNSPAAEAGIRRGDQILSINGRRITTLDDLDDVMHVPVGTRLDILTRRAGEERRVQLTLATPPAMEADKQAGDSELPPPVPAEVDEDLGMPQRQQYPTLGVSVVDVTRDNQNQYRFSTPQGAVITRIVEGSPADEYGLPLGGVIVAVEGQRIDSSNDLVVAIQAYKPGDEVELMYFRGNQIARKKVRLGSGAPPVVAPSDSATRRPATDPPLRLGPSRTDRPLLNRLERALDDIVPSVIDSATGGARGRATDPAAVQTPPAPADDVAELRLQVETLQRQLQLMQQRIQLLEEALNKKGGDD
jgi:predicted metalloprotease with PDZ domain